MPDDTPGAAEADYDDWLDNQWNRDDYDPDDPTGKRQAFMAGWTRGAAYVALRVSRELGVQHLPKDIVDHLPDGGDEPSRHRE